MQVVRFDHAQGQAVAAVFLCSKMWERLPAIHSVIPPAEFMCTFDLKTEGKTWLILDTYGNPDAGLCYEFAPTIFGKDFWDQTIAIDRDTGEIVTAILHLGEEGYTVALADLYEDEANPIVPALWLRRLDELASAKRPFAVTVPSRTLSQYISHDLTRSDLRQAVQIQLFFTKQESLILSHYGVQVVTEL